MKNVKVNSRWAEDESVTILNAVIIYEDAGLAERVYAMLERSAGMAKSSALWRVKFWRLDEFLLPAREDAVLEHAAAASLIVLAVGGRTPLPRLLLQRLETWSARRVVPDAALALFLEDKNNTRSASSPGELSWFARQHGLTFICDDSLSPADEPAALGHAFYQH